MSNNKSADDNEYSDDGSVICLRDDDNPILWADRVNQVFFPNYATQADDMKAIEGNCTAITFFQFVKCSRMNFETFMNGMANMDNDPNFLNFVSNNDYMLRKVWDGIYSGKYGTYRAAIPCQGAIDKAGVMQYRIFDTFNMYIMCVCLGHDMFGITPLDVKKAEVRLKQYMIFMGQYTVTIPLMALGHKSHNYNYETNAYTTEPYSCHIFCNVYDTVHRKFICFDSNLTKDTFYMKNNIYYPNVTLIDRTIEIVYNMEVSIPYDEIHQRNNAGIPVEDFDLFLFADPVQTGANLVNLTSGYALQQFFYACQPYKKSDVVSIFRKYYGTRSGFKDFENAMNDISNIKADEWAYEMRIEVSNGKRIIAGKYYKQWESIFGFIFKCITGRTYKQIRKHFRKVAIPNKNKTEINDVMAKIKKAAVEYVSNMSNHFAHVPMVSIAMNTLYEKDNMLMKQPELFYCFTSLDCKDNKFSTYITYKGFGFTDPSESYTPFFVYVPDTLLPYSYGVAIDRNTWFKLLDNQINAQLKYTYSCHFDN